MGTERGRVTVLDAFAVLALLNGEPAAPEVRDLIESGETTPTVSTLNLAEVFDQLVRVSAASPEQTHRALNLLELSGVRSHALTDAVARRAGELRAGHYHRSRNKVSMADCACAATAEALAMPLATADGALARMARAEGIPVVALADSRGRRP